VTRRLLGLLTSLACIATTIAASSTTAAAQADLDPEDPGVVDLVEQTTWIEPDGDVLLEIDVSDTPRDAIVKVTFHERLAGRFELAESLSGEVGSTLRTIADQPVAELDPDGDGRVAVAFGLQSSAVDPQRIRVNRGGLHPVKVEVSDLSGDTIGGFVTHVARLPEEIEAQLGLAIVQTFPASPSRQPDGTTSIDAAARSELTSATETFGTDPQVPVTFRFTPELFDALAASAEPLDASLLDDIGAMADTPTTAVSPYVGLDLDALADAGLDDVVSDQFALGTETTQARIGARPDEDTWIIDEPLGGIGLGALAEQGIEQIVVPYELLSGPMEEPQVRPFDLNDGALLRIPALATDPGLQSHAGSTTSPILDAQHLLADAAAIWFDRPSDARGVALRLPDGTPDRTFVRAALAGIADSPLFTAGSVADVIAAAEPAAVGGIDATVDAPEDRLVLGLRSRDVPDLGSYRTQLRRAESAAATSADVFREASSDDTDPLQIAVSAAIGLTPGQRQRYLTTVTDRVDADLANIAMPERAVVTLPSRNGVIPITLVNNTGKVATVAIELDSDRLEFPDGDRLEFTLSDTLNPVEIPVEVRSSGAFPLDMSLETPAGDEQLVASTYTIRSTAVSGLGIALSVAAIGVLAFWWFRTARRARRAHREARDDGSLDEPDE
jgi:Family of unknown function (DUF6049)